MLSGVESLNMRSFLERFSSIFKKKNKKKKFHVLKKSAHPHLTFHKITYHDQFIESLTTSPALSP